METKIIVKNWSIRTKEDKSRTITGIYAVLCGATEVATSKFNDTFDSVDINIPTEIMAEVEELSEKIKIAIVANFTG